MFIVLPTFTDSCNMMFIQSYPKAGLSEEMKSSLVLFFKGEDDIYSPRVILPYLHLKDDLHFLVVTFFCLAAMINKHIGVLMYIRVEWLMHTLNVDWLIKVGNIHLITEDLLLVLLGHIPRALRISNLHSQLDVQVNNPI